MFKIPDFPLAPPLCKQAGLDFVSARRDFDPCTLVSGNLRHFDTAVRCAAHYAGATLTFKFFMDRTPAQVLPHQCKKPSGAPNLHSENSFIMTMLYTNPACQPAALISCSHWSEAITPMTGQVLNVYFKEHDGQNISHRVRSLSVSLWCWWRLFSIPCWNPLSVEILSSTLFKFHACCYFDRTHCSAGRQSCSCTHNQS